MNASYSFSLTSSLLLVLLQTSLPIGDQLKYIEAEYADQREMLIHELENLETGLIRNPEWKGQYYHLLAESYNKLEQDSLAIKYWQLTLDHLPHDNGDSLALIANIGLTKIHTETFNSEKALQYGLEALRILEKDKFPDFQPSELLRDIGFAYELERDSLQALTYYRQAHFLAKADNDTFALVGSSMDLGNYYLAINRDSANFYYSICDQLSNSSDDLKDSHFAVSINMIINYLNGRWEEHYPRAKAILKELDNLYMDSTDKRSRLAIERTYAAYYEVTSKDYQQALLYNKKALTLARELEDYRFELNLLANNVRMNRLVGNYEEALERHIDYFHLYEKLLNEDKNRAFRDIQTKYEVESKNQHIQLLERDKQLNKQRLIWLGLVIALLILFLFGGYLFYQYRLKRKEEIRKQEREKLLNEKEIELLQSQIESQEKEQHRLAQELHDGLATQLAALGLQLGMIDQDNIIDENWSRFKDGFRDIIDSTRKFSHQLSRYYTSNRSLQELISELGQAYKDLFDFKPYIQPEDIDKMISYNVKHNLFRISQELVNNSAKHANATELIYSLTIIEEEKIIQLLVEDNGQGFDSNTNKGIGLKTIEERVAALGGQLNIDSKLGRGVCVLIRIPIW